MSNNNRANIYWAVTICKVHLMCFISFTFQYNFVTGHYCPYFEDEEPVAHWDQGDAFKKEQTQQVWLHVLNCSLYCLGIQSKLPLLMLLQPVPVLSEDMGIFRSCCVGFLWRDLWVFSQQPIPWGCFEWTSLHSVRLCGGGCNKMGVTFKLAVKSLCVSCPHGKKPASWFSRGSRETGEAQPDWRDVINQVEGLLAPGEGVPNKYEVSPRQHCEQVPWCMLPREGPFHGKNK